MVLKRDAFTPTLTEEERKVYRAKRKKEKVVSIKLIDDEIDMANALMRYYHTNKVGTAIKSEAFRLFKAPLVLQELKDKKK